MTIGRKPRSSAGGTRQPGGEAHDVSAACVRDNGHDDGVVVATEYEPANRLRTMTLPFTGGLEFTIRID